MELATYRLQAAEARLAAAAKVVQILGERFDAVHQAVQGGDLSYQEAELARDRLRTAMRETGDARSYLAYARADLNAMIGMPEHIPAVRAVALDELAAAVAERDHRLAVVDLSRPRSLTPRLVEVGRDTQQKRLSATPSYRPNLSVAVTGAYSPDSGYGAPLSASGSLSFSFSPSDVKARERKELTRDLQAASEDAEDARVASRAEADRLQQVLQLARDDYLQAEQELARAESLLAEVTESQALGKAAALDVQQAEVAAEAEATQVFESLTAIAAAQDGLLLLCEP